MSIGKISCNAVKRSLLEVTNLPFPINDHTQHAGHNTPHGNGSIAICGSCIIQQFTIFYGHDAGKINSHSVIFDRTHNTRRTKVCICGHRFGFLNTSSDLFLCLGINPDAKLCHALSYTTIITDILFNCLSFFSRVPCPVDGINILSVQKHVNDIILLLYVLNDSIFIGLRKKRQICQHPAFVANIVFLRVDHFYQMTYTPCNDIILILYITVISA